MKDILQSTGFGATNLDEKSSTLDRQAPEHPQAASGEGESAKPDAAQAVEAEAAAQRLRAEAAEAFARHENARARDIEERLTRATDHLAAIESSTIWRLTALLRWALRAATPLIRLVKRCVLLLWWLVTLQLPSRLRARRRHLQARARAADATQLRLTAMLHDWLSLVSEESPPALRPAFNVPLFERYLEETGLSAEAARAWPILLTTFRCQVSPGENLNTVAASLRDSVRFEVFVQRILGNPWFDAEYYRGRHRLSGTDPEIAIHYLLVGEPLGLRPSERFDPVYYGEQNADASAAALNCLLHYAETGRDEGRHPLPPVIIEADAEARKAQLIALTVTVERWLDTLRPLQANRQLILSPALLEHYLLGLGLNRQAATVWQDALTERTDDTVTGHRASAALIAMSLSGNTQFETLAQRAWESGQFDANFYCAQAGLVNADPDAARHYLMLGEPLGLRPSPAFDPGYYIEEYPDVAAAGLSGLLHYTEFGRGERRRPIPPQIVHARAEPADPARDNVLLVVHETSRTGAPILGWNIASQLAEKYNVYTIRLGDGALTPAFEALSVAVYGPFAGVQSNPADVGKALRGLMTSRSFKYAIVNSIESRPVLDVCAQYGIPTLLLVHEFGSYVWPAQSLKAALDAATGIVFPAPIVAQSSVQAHPALRERGFHIEPQGMSRVPPDDAHEAGSVSPEMATLSRARAAGAFIVMGAGSVNLRKGVDLFIAVAADVKRLGLDRPVHFLWIGGGYRPEQDMGYSIYLKEQLERSQLQGQLTFMEEVADLEAIYALAHVFLLASRLDPLPNVSIDALCRGIPTICFKDASGTAELMLDDPDTAGYVAAHLDVKGAADLIGRLASDEAEHQRMVAATRRLGERVFNMQRYVERLDVLGLEMSKRN